jgi:hypothetical protein
MKWSEGLICRALATQFFKHKCLLLVPNTTWAGAEADVLGVTMDLRIVDVEIKISRSDLKADAAKEKWWKRASNWKFEYDRAVGPPAPDVRRDWPRRVWKHYYALPAEIWKPELLEALPSPCSGVLLLHEGNGVDGIGNPWIDVRVERRATPNKAADRLEPEHVIDIARLSNLRMWDAYARLHRNQTTEAA